HRDQVVVLMYHGVLPDDEHLAEGDWLQVRASEFRAQMAFLAEHYEVCRIKDVLAPPIAPPARPRALVTFDDGYANNLHVALPILREYTTPASIFLVTGHVDTRRLFWWDRLHLACLNGAPPEAEQVRALKARSPRDIKAAVDAYLAAKQLEAPETAPEAYRVLSRGEITALADSGLIEFGSHTHGHEILENLSKAEASATLEISAERLIRWGLTAGHFAAPNGDYTDGQIELIQQAGYTTCFGTRPGIWNAPQEPYCIPRMGIGRGTNIDQFALLVSGFSHWLRRESAYPE
ncbi:MAG: polysaccharide deacetylase family protein, partial [Burkholderiales bacterium]